MDSLEVNGLRILLEQTPSGPILSTEDYWLAPLAWVVNSAISGGGAEGLTDALERGDDLIVQGLYAARPEPDDPLVDEAKARWQTWTGNDAGEDIYVVGTTFCENEVAIPRRTLMAIMTKIKNLHQQAPIQPVPWLFRVNPIHPDPGEGEEAIMRNLEKQAINVDKLEQESIEKKNQSMETAAMISAKRRFLFSELADAGLFHRPHETNKRLWLTTWELPTLVGYFEAALKLLAYFSSVERRRYIPEAEAEPVQGARVSIDWFRFRPPLPKGFRPEQWLGYCESIFMNEINTEGGEGEIYVHERDLRFILHWRKDDGITPALLYATLL